MHARTGVKFPNEAAKATVDKAGRQLHLAVDQAAYRQMQ
jgi:hypothetical protein